jgi:uncharacterized membrane protein
MIKMARNIFLVIGGIFLSLVLTVVSAWGILKFTSLGKSIREGEQTENIQRDRHELETQEYKDIFVQMEQTLWIIKLVIMPVISLVVGSFIGIFARKHLFVLSIISLTPLLAAFLISSSWKVSGLFYCILYALLASLASLAVSHLKTHPDSRLP